MHARRNRNGDKQELGELGLPAETPRKRSRGTTRIGRKRTIEDEASQTFCEAAEIVDSGLTQEFERQEPEPGQFAVAVSDLTFTMMMARRLDRLTDVMDSGLAGIASDVITTGEGNFRSRQNMTQAIHTLSERVASLGQSPEDPEQPGKSHRQRPPGPTKPDQAKRLPPEDVARRLCGEK